MLRSLEPCVYLTRTTLSIVSDRLLGVPLEQTIDSHLRRMSRNMLIYKKKVPNLAAVGQGCQNLGATADDRVAPGFQAR